jgi:hypothetical protein
MKEQKKYSVPISLQGSLQSMFGWGTKIGSSTHLSDSEFKKVVEKVLNELERYLSKNVQTDPFHQEELQRAIKSAKLYFNDEYWWPGVFEGLVRLSLLLMGDLPTHEKYSKGKKDNDYYRLDLHRSVGWFQNNSQKIRMIYYAERLGKLDKKLWQLRKEFHESKESTDFILWFREKYPTEYAKVF